jgi:hypothetical protein
VQYFKNAQGKLSFFVFQASTTDPAIVTIKVLTATSHGTFEPEQTLELNFPVRYILILK